MELERGAPPFIVLRRDQPAIEPQVFRTHRFERKRERIEMVGDGRQLARRRAWQSHAVGLLLELGEAACQHGERAEHAAEQDIEHADHRDIKQQGPGADRDGVFPGLGDFVGRLAGNLHLADAAAVGSDRHDMRLDRRRDQGREPGRRRCALVRAAAARAAAADGGHGARRRGNGNARRVLDRDPHMTQRAQLRRQHRQELLGGELLVYEIDGIADEQLGEAYRCSHLDAGLRAGAPDRNTPGDERGCKVDQNKDQQQLGANRAPIPQRTQEPPPLAGRRLRHRERAGN